jgi:hypothetical protein
MADDHTNAPTVKFNVGGKAYETSRSLFLHHEDTMLARLVSDTWHVDSTKPIFIDRNEVTFGFVLDYLRYGRIVLPMTVSKEMFLLDMDFYGILHDEGTVKTTAEEWAVQVAGQVSNRLENMKNLEAERTHLDLIHDINFLANYCADKFKLNCSGTISIEAGDGEKGTKTNLERAVGAIRSQEKYMTTFRSSLSILGFRLSHDIRYYPKSNCWSIVVTRFVYP